MLGILIFGVCLVAFVLLTCWLGRGGETSGKSWDSSGGWTGGDGV
jgi:hypothetical protein